MRKFYVSSLVVVVVGAIMAMWGGTRLAGELGSLSGPDAFGAGREGGPPIGRATMPVGKNIALGRPYKINRPIWRDKEYRMTELRPCEDANGPWAFTWPAPFDSGWGHGRIGKFTYYLGELTDGRVARSPNAPQVVRWEGDDYDGQSLRPTPLRVTIDLQRVTRVWGARIGVWRGPREVDAPQTVEIECGTAANRKFRTVARVSTRRGRPGRRRRGVSFAPARARYVRVTFRSAVAGVVPPLALDEIEIVGDPVGPRPRPAVVSGPMVPKRVWLPDRLRRVRLDTPRKLNLRVEWGFGPTHRLWRGGLRVVKGKIEAARDFRFDGYRFVDPKRMDRLLSQDATSCQWVSATGGDTDGALLTVNGSAETEIVFTAKGLASQVRVPLKRLIERPARTEEFRIGEEGHKVRFFVPHVFAEKLGPITKVKPIATHSLLSLGRAPACAVVIPSDPAYRPLAERVRSAIGVGGIPIWTDRQVMTGGLRLRLDLPGRPTLILIGNLCNNRAMIPLYGRRHGFYRS